MQAYIPNVRLDELVPFLVLAIGAVLTLVVDAVSDKRGARETLPWITGAALFASALTFFLGVVPAPVGSGTVFAENTFASTSMAPLGAVVLLFSSLIMTIMAPSLIERRNLPAGEYYTLILFASLGGLLFSYSNELLTAFIALEIMSLSLYVLTGIDRRSGKAAEASFKYLILGSFASAFFIFGVAFLYGATQSTYLHEMSALLATAPETVNSLWVFIGFGLLLVGMCFKLSLAPFHMWAPDVYEGANTPAVLLIATGSKVASLIFLANVLHALSSYELFPTAASFLLGLIAVASMLWGNLGALAQVNFKRLMAYSSIAQTGYIAVALVVDVAISGSGMAPAELAAARTMVTNAMSLYLAGYTLMSALALGIAYLIGGEGHMSGYRGLIHRNPVAATAMAIALFSLVGIGFTPPTIGFMGKYYLFKEAVNHGFVALATIAVLTSVISAFYYLSLVVTMFMREETEDTGVRLACMREQRMILLSSDGLTRVTMGVCAALIFIVGFFPNGFISLAETMAKGLFH
jgi:NADH-quinone oxidoreductase subunit N